MNSEYVIIIEVLWYFFMLLTELSNYMYVKKVICFVAMK